MTSEDLLKPRIKVVADFWDSPFKVGDIIQFTNKAPFFDFFTQKHLYDDWLSEWCINLDGSQQCYWLKRFTNYPHLFCLMPWWEDRNPKDLPEYIQYGNRAIYKVRWDFSENNLGSIAWDANNDDRDLPLLPHVVPSTEEDYKNYKAKQK